MTLDPIFAFNADAAEVSNEHTAERVIERSPSVFQFEAPWRIELANGDVVRGTAQEPRALKIAGNCCSKRTTSATLPPHELALVEGLRRASFRPVLVIQSDLLNRTGHPSTWVLPCTTRLAGENLLRVVLPQAIAGNTKHCEVMIDQSRAIDNRCFRRLLGRLPAPLMREVKAKLKQLAEL
jgi:mRNA interferase MazF